MKSVNLICACTQPLAADMMLSGKGKKKKKGKIPGENLPCLWIFSVCECLKFLLPVSCLYMRSILPKCWAVTLGGHILKLAPVTIHISECLCLFMRDF